MRVLVAGAMGAIGRPFLRQLAATGHQCFGLTRYPQKESTIRALGAPTLRNLAIGSYIAGIIY